MRVIAVPVAATAFLFFACVAGADPVSTNSSMSSISQPPAAAATTPAQTTANSQTPSAAPPGSPGTPETVVVQGQAASNGVNLDEIVCRSEPPTTGSRLGAGRECHTVRQWNERERQEQRMLQVQQAIGSAMSH
jgi:hypothetical protein